ncbi:MAG: hypothetical protein DPW09_01780 [Anaerolineae bacterium]|nr:hypothetical protein [Anaerolineae bacterium]
MAQHDLPQTEVSSVKRQVSRSTLYASRLTPHASHTTHHAPRLLFLAVFLTVFTLYLLTLAPGVVGGDAGEHQFAAPLLGIPHTTGYPLYILLGKLWTLLIPFGSPAWRMNLFSALNGALAAAVTALIVYYLTPHASRFTPHASSFILHPSSFLSAFLTGLTLTWGLTLWQWSVIAGVRSMNVLFFALITLAAILWGKRMEEWKSGRMNFTANQPSNPPTFQPSNLPNPDPQPPTPYLLALLTGLSLAHHRTTLFYLPSIALWVLWHDPHLLRRPRQLLSLALLGLAPLLLYLFIYFRGINQPPYSHEIIRDWPSFWFLVGSGDSQGLFLSIDPAFLPARLAFIWQDLLAQLSWPGVILAALGGVWLLWRQPRHFLFQSLLLLLLLLFTLDFEVVNLNEAPAWYLMPAYMLLAVWVGLGANWIYDLRFTIYDLRLKTTLHDKTGHKIIPTAIHHLPSTIFYLLSSIPIFLLAYTLAWPNFQRIYADSVAPLDEWRQLVRGTQGQRLVESSLSLVEPNSIIWGDWEQYTPFKYYQLINGWRSDVTVRNPLDRWPEKVAMAHAAGQPVYFTRKPTDLIGTPYLTMVGPLIYLQTAPQFQTPANLTLVNANFEDELELIGYHTQIWPTPSLPPPFRERVGPILQLMLYWRAPHKLTWDYALSLRLLDSMGQEIYKKDAAHPVLSSYPTTLWTPGEVVGDFYELPLPPNSTAITLHLLPYRTEGPGQWHNLTQAGQEGLKLNLEP